MPGQPSAKQRNPLGREPSPRRAGAAASAAGAIASAGRGAVRSLGGYRWKGEELSTDLTWSVRGKSRMQRAVISYHGGELEARELEDGWWIVGLGELTATSRYLDLALAELLDDAEGVHHLAAELLGRLVPAPEQTEALESTH